MIKIKYAQLTFATTNTLSPGYRLMSTSLTQPAKSQPYIAVVILKIFPRVRTWSK